MFYERDIRQIKAGEKTELVYTTVTGIKSDLSGPQQIPEILDNTVENSSSNDSDSTSNDSDSEEDKKQFVSSARPRDESPNSRKVCSFHFNDLFFSKSLCYFKHYNCSRRGKKR